MSKLILAFLIATHALITDAKEKDIVREIKPLMDELTKKRIHFLSIFALKIFCFLLKMRMPMGKNRKIYKG